VTALLLVRRTGARDLAPHQPHAVLTIVVATDVPRKLAPCNKVGLGPNAGNRRWFAGEPRFQVEWASSGFCELLESAGERIGHRDALQVRASPLVRATTGSSARPGAITSSSRRVTGYRIRLLGGGCVPRRGRGRFARFRGFRGTMAAVHDTATGAQLQYADGSAITLTGVTKAHLTVDDFHFA
jgi:hypothetical protein